MLIFLILYMMEWVHLVYIYVRLKIKSKQRKLGQYLVQIFVYIRKMNNKNVFTFYKMAQQRTNGKCHKSGLYDIHCIAIEIKNDAAWVLWCLDVRCHAMRILRLQPMRILFALAVFCLLVGFLRQSKCAKVCIYLFCGMW